jgi:VanZ family protein
MVLITISSSIPMDAAHADRWYAGLEPNLQNLLHIPLFALLSYLWARTFNNRSHRNILFPAVLLAILFGFFDELHQMVIPGRYAGLLDILLNTTGALIGVFIFRLIPAGHKTVDPKSNLAQRR